MKKFKWNKGAVVLAIMIGAYAAFGGAAITVYALDGRSADKNANAAAEEANLQAEAPSEADYTMSEEEYEEFMKLYGSAATETETGTEVKAETEKSEDLSAYREKLEETDQVLAEAGKTVQEEEVPPEEEKPEEEQSSESTAAVQNESDDTVEVAVIDGETGEVTDTTAKTDTASAADTAAAAAEDGKKYYTYKVTGIGTSLTLHRTKTEKNDSIGDIPEGYTGYVIEDPAKGDKRTLIIYKGKVGYGSNMYLNKTEISAADYPEELKSITADDAGNDVLDGKTAGPAEGT